MKLKKSPKNPTLLDKFKNSIENSWHCTGTSTKTFWKHGKVKMVYDIEENICKEDNSHLKNGHFHAHGLNVDIWIMLLATITTNLTLVVTSLNIYVIKQCFWILCYILAIVLYVPLRFTDSDYPFGIFKLFLQ